MAGAFVVETSRCLHELHFGAHLDSKTAAATDVQMQTARNQLEELQTYVGIDIGMGIPVTNHILNKWLLNSRK